MPHPEEGGWRAMAITDKGVSAVVLSGGSAKWEDALSILRKLVARP